ncbi:MAG: hypothetical protein GY949_11410 [Gammaproteobacteria bacterium]|nr:hypothetical protein [Gammaproteobacteria bacterium]
MLLTPQMTALRNQYRFDDLLHATRSQEAFFVQYYRMMGHEISRAHIARSRALVLQSGTRFRNTVWLSDERATRKPPEENPILVDSFEFASFANAELGLLNLLEEFHVPVTLRPVNDRPGTLGFVASDERFVAFLRGNSLHRLTQENPTQPLTDVARSIDGKLIARPEDAENVAGAIDLTEVAQVENLAAGLALDTASAPTIAAQYSIAGIGRFRQKSRATVAAAVASSEDEVPMSRIFSKGGWIEDHDGLKFNLYADADRGEAEIEVFEDTSADRYTRCRCALKGGRWAEYPEGESL